VEGIVFTKDDIRRHEREPLRNREAGERHQNRIRRLEETQRRKREWINFDEIAEWCSELSGTAERNEAARAGAYKMLEEDLLAGDFEENGRSRVLFLFPEVLRARMARQWLRDAIDNNYDGKHGRSYLQHCWLPRELFDRWCAKHNLPESPRRFQPQSVDKNELSTEPRQPLSANHEATPKESYRTGAPGKPSSAHLVKNELERRGETGQIESNLEKQAKSLAEWLKEKHPNAPPMTVRTIENQIRDLYRSLKNPQK
jgi:hypothetical protein